MKQLYLKLEDILSRLENELKILDYVSGLSLKVGEIEEDPAREDLWKYWLMAKQLSINNEIISDYIGMIKSNEIGNLNILLNIMKEEIDNKKRSRELQTRRDPVS